MMIHKITPSKDYNNWLKRLDTQLNEPTNPNSKSSKLISQQIRKRYYKTLGTCGINSQMTKQIDEHLSLLVGLSICCLIKCFKGKIERNLNLKFKIRSNKFYI